MDPTKLTLVELSAAIDRREVTCSQVMEAFIRRYKERDNELGAFLHVLKEKDLMHQARTADARILNGTRIGPLDGIPIAVKDNISTKGIPTTCASKMLEHYIPPYDATAIIALKEAGAIVFGKTNMDEFAMGSSTENSAYKVTHNPYDIERVPGGTSGGSAVAVASRQCPVALASDTGGSVRQPASFCNVVGFKPTYGRISRYGLIAYASSLDQIGVVAATPKDISLVFDVISSLDPLDSTSIEASGSRKNTLSSLKIALPKEFYSDQVDDDTRILIGEKIAKLKSMGVRFGEVSIPSAGPALNAYYVIASSEASSNLSRYDGVKYGHRASGVKTIEDLNKRSRTEAFGGEVKRRIIMGTYFLSAGYADKFYKKAQSVRAKVTQEFDAVFEEYDYILSPVSPFPAFKIGSKTNNPLDMYMADILSIFPNLTKTPSISLPAGFTKNGLPVGLQLISRRNSDEALLADSEKIYNLWSNDTLERRKDI